MADVVQSSTIVRHCHRGDGPVEMTASTTSVQTDTGSRPKRPSTREKIAKMVADGAVNYPAYLKLIYTGDSEQEPSSSEDELSVAKPREVGAAHASASAASASRFGTAPFGDERTELKAHSKLEQLAKVDSCTDPNELMYDGPEIRRVTGAVESVASYHDIDRHCSTTTGYEEALQSMTSAYSTECTTVEQQSTDEELQRRNDLIRIQEDIATIRGVLNTKLAKAATLRQLLGVQGDLRNGLQTIARSQTFQKTNAAFKSFSAYASRAMSSLRQSVPFKSVELKVGSLQTSQSMGNFKQRMARLRSSKSENNVSAASTTVDDIDKRNYDDDVDCFDTKPHRHSMTSATNHINMFSEESVG